MKKNTNHYSLITNHYSLITNHYSLITNHYSLITTHYSLLTVLSLLLCLTACSPREKTARLMTYNIRNGIGMDNQRDLSRVAAVINAYRPDVVAVQEVDSATRRSGGLDILGELAKLTGLKPVYAPAIDYDGGKYGVGLLCRKPPLSVEQRVLPGREEQRTVVTAEFDGFVFACTHLSLTAADRVMSFPILWDVALRHAGKPFYLAGDFNAEPGEPFIRMLTDRFDILTDTTVRTFPADEPDITIDYIVSRDDEVEKSKSQKVEKPESRKAGNKTDADVAVASDHRPVCIDITYKTKQKK